MEIGCYFCQVSEGVQWYLVSGVNVEQPIPRMPNGFEKVIALKATLEN